MTTENANVDVKSYAQWMMATVKAENSDLQIKKAHLAYGKFHKPDNMDAEISAAEIDKLAAKPGANVKIASCGRSDSPSGTTGEFAIYDGSTHVGTYHWNCPWGREANSHQWDKGSSSYKTQLEPTTPPESGALGKVRILVFKMI